MAATFPDLASIELIRLDDLLLQVAQMQTCNAAVDEILGDLSDGMEPADLADAQHELAAIARALRNLTRIGEAHDAALREATNG